MMRPEKAKKDAPAKKSESCLRDRGLQKELEGEAED